jgi:hypothetical protein
VLHEEANLVPSTDPVVTGPSGGSTVDHVKLRRSARAVGLLLAAGLVAFTAVSGRPSAATDPPVVDQTGWWSATGATVVPGVTPAIPAPPTVPAGSIAVGAVGGQTSMVAGVGLVIGAAPGATVTKLSLALRPADGNGTDTSTAVTAIRACPMTVFWAGVENGPIDQAPTSDCAVAAANGTRGADGTWTFDLTAIAAMWVDPASGLAMNGVLLQPAPAGQTFSVAFATGSAIVATLEATDPPASTDTTTFSNGAALTPDTSAATSAPTDPAPVTTDPAPVDPVAGPTTVATSPPAPAPGTTVVPEGAAAPRLAVPSAGPGTFGGWPLGVYLAIAGALVLAALASLTLGLSPDHVGETREGGLSRALAARSTNLEVR